MSPETCAALETMLRRGAAWAAATSPIAAALLDGARAEASPSDDTGTGPGGWLVFHPISASLYAYSHRPAAYVQVRSEIGRGSLVIDAGGEGRPTVRWSHRLPPEILDRSPEARPRTQPGAIDWSTVHLREPEEGEAAR